MLWQRKLSKLCFFIFNRRNFENYDEEEVSNLMRNTKNELKCTFYINYYISYKLQFIKVISRKGFLFSTSR